MFCANCGEKLEKEAKFCSECGTPVAEEEELQEVTRESEETSENAEQETFFCPECGVAAKGDDQFCESCGSPLHDRTPKKTVIPKRWIAYGIAAGLILLAVLFIPKLLGGSGMKGSHLFYLRDEKIYLQNFSKQSEPKLVSEIDVEELGDKRWPLRSFFSNASFFMEDGNIVYPGDIKSDHSGISSTLYHRKLKQDHKDAEKIASNVTHVIAKPDNILFYTRGDDHRLYRFAKKESEKIDDNVIRYVISKDGNTVYYVKNDDLYYWQAETGKERIDRGISEGQYAELYGEKLISQDFSKIYYRKEDNLYVWDAKQKEKNKVASEIRNVYRNQAMDGIYYTVAKVQEVSLKDLLVDDLREEDKKAEKPSEPKYPSRSDYKEEKLYNEAVEKHQKDLEEYHKKLESYRDVERREELRKKLDSIKTEITLYDLYYSHGEEKEKIDSDVLGVISTGNTSDALLYTRLRKDHKPSIKMSDYESETDLSKVFFQGGEHRETILYRKGEAQVLECGFISQAFFGKDDQVVALQELPQVEEGEDREGSHLLKMDIQSSAKTPVKLIENIGDFLNVSIDQQGDIYALASNHDDGGVQLYHNEKVVDQDAGSFGSLIDGIFYYGVDAMNEDYTLKSYDGKQTKEISQDVSIFEVLNAQHILLLYDRTELYHYNGKEKVKIASDVDAFALPKLDKTSAE